MPGICLLDGVHGKGSDGIRHLFRVCGHGGHGGSLGLCLAATAKLRGEARNRRQHAARFQARQWRDAGSHSVSKN